MLSWGDTEEKSGIKGVRNMSGATSSSVAVGVGIGGGGELGYGVYRTPFTAVQWQELEHQAMIYKYLVAGLPVPPDLVLPIRRSFDALSARFFHHPSCNHLDVCFLSMYDLCFYRYVCAQSDARDQWM